jgi:hypothetical protein
MNIPSAIDHSRIDLSELPLARILPLATTSEVAEDEDVPEVDGVKDEEDLIAITFKIVIPPACLFSLLRSSCFGFL